MKATFLNGVFLFLQFLFLLSILYYQYKRNNTIIIIIQALHLKNYKFKNIFEHKGIQEIIIFSFMQATMVQDYAFSSITA